MQFQLWRIHFILLYFIAHTGCRLLATPLAAGLVVAAGCLLVPTCLIIFPTAYGVRILRRRYSKRKWRKEREKIEQENRELGDPLVFKRYSARHAYKMGDREIEVAYPWCMSVCLSAVDIYSTNYTIYIFGFSGACKASIFMGLIRNSKALSLQFEKNTEWQFGHT